MDAQGCASAKGTTKGTTKGTMRTSWAYGSRSETCCIRCCHAQPHQPTGTRFGNGQQPLIRVRPLEASFFHLRLEELTTSRGKLSLGGRRCVDVQPQCVHDIRFALRSLDEI